MCGIAGLLTAGSGDADGTSAILQNMTRSLAHRGPDAEGYWMEGEVALGHRRLSILDLSDAGAQPMRSESGRHVIVFNGEIYNHLDMRRDLAADGAAPDWRGHSDTETLLAGITHWGLDETLQRAKGMFALALWDRSEKRLSLARDRMGEKPLYWGWAGQALVFGSELKALRRIPIARVMCAATHWRNICALCTYRPRAAFILASTNWNQEPSSRSMVRRLPHHLRSRSALAGIMAALASAGIGT